MQCTSSLFFYWGGGVITDLKLINFVIKHQFNPQLLKNSLTDHIYFTKKTTINFAVSDISSEFRRHINNLHISS